MIFFSLPQLLTHFPPPAPIGFLQMVHHKRISQKIHVSFSREVIHRPLNFSCGLLLIDLLIYPHPISQIVLNFRQADWCHRHVSIAAVCTSFVVRPCTFPIIEPSQKVHVFRIVYGLVFCPASEWTETSAFGSCHAHHWATHRRYSHHPTWSLTKSKPNSTTPADISFPCTKTAY